MQPSVYIDMLFIINTLIAYFVLRASGLICQDNISIARICMASVFAGFCSFVILMPPMSTLVAWIYKITTAFLICAIAFSIKSMRALFKRIFWYIFLNLSLAGVVFAAMYYFNASGMHTNNLAIYFDVSPPVLLLCIVTVYLCVKLSGILFGQPKNIKHAKLNFFIAEKNCTCTALLDTGFKVNDPIGGKKSFLISLNAIEAQLNPLSVEDINKFFDGSTPQNGTMLMLICIHTATGVKTLPSVKASNITVNIDNKKLKLKEANAVFCSENLGDGSFDAVFGTDFISQI